MRLPAEEVIRMTLQIAKHVPRDVYDDLLRQTHEAANIQPCELDKDLITSVEQLREAVQGGQYTLVWGYTDHVGRDWYGNEETFFDKDNIGPLVERYLRAAMAYVTHARYKEAIQVLDILFSIELEIEHYDYAKIDILFSHSIISLEYKEILCHYAYAIIMHSQGQERAMRLFGIEQLYGFSITLQEIEDTGPVQFPEQEAFAAQWVKYLLEQDLSRHPSLIIDAVMYQGGIAALETFVLAHGVQYPKAYIQLLETYMSMRRFDDAIRIIENGLAKMEGVYPYRVEMADMLSEIGQEMDSDVLYRRGIKEAFYSSVDIKHFLPLYELKDNALLAKAMQYLDAYHEARECDPPIAYYYIHFLQGDYDLVWAACRKDKNSLGWSNSTKGKLMPLFVALLASTHKMGDCVSRYLDGNFSSSYYYYRLKDRKEKVLDRFSQALCASFKPLPPDIREQYMCWCAQEAEERVQAVVGGMHRGSYHKASALIVSIAESMYAQGDAIGAAAYVKGYMDKYPRHISFRKCMREEIKQSPLDINL